MRLLCRSVLARMAQRHAEYCSCNWVLGRDCAAPYEHPSYALYSSEGPPGACRVPSFSLAPILAVGTAFNVAEELVVATAFSLFFFV